MSCNSVSGRLQGKASEVGGVGSTTPVGLNPLWAYGCQAGSRACARDVAAFAVPMTSISARSASVTPRPVTAEITSGVFFALVILGLRAQSDASPIWLTVVNHISACVLLLPFLWNAPLPTWPQVGVLIVFGVVQMGMQLCQFGGVIMHGLFCRMIVVMVVRGLVMLR